MLEEAQSNRRSVAVGAVDHDRSVARNSRGPVGQLAQRHGNGPGDVSRTEFVAFPDVQDEGRRFRSESLSELLRPNPRYRLDRPAGVFPGGEAPGKAPDHPVVTDPIELPRGVSRSLLVGRHEDKGSFRRQMPPDPGTERAVEAEEVRPGNVPGVEVGEGSKV